MVFRSIFSLLVFLSVCITARAENGTEPDSKQQEVALRVLQVLEEQPDSIEDWVDGRMYLVPERICVTRQGVFLCKNRSAIPLPCFAFDQKGVFIVCDREDVIKETQARYARMFDELMDALNLDPFKRFNKEPTAIFEGFRALEAPKEEPQLPEPAQ
jgi:hypothetical protein